MPEQRSKIISRLKEELADIIWGHDVLPVFQPIFTQRAPFILGYEALIRLPKDSMIGQPSRLFSLAHRTKQLEYVEDLCLIKTLHAHQSLTLPGMLFLNMSPINLLNRYQRFGADNFLPLSHSTLSPQRIVIELTEQYRFDDLPTLKAALADLRQRGYRIALDDLGAGYSSLISWLEMGPDFVKLDREFIHNIDKNPRKQAFARNLFNLAEQLDCHSIVEGIETVHELNSIIHIGFSLFQGYLLAYPASHPKPDIPALLLNPRSIRQQAHNTAML